VSLSYVSHPVIVAVYTVPATRAIPASTSIPILFLTLILSLTLALGESDTATVKCGCADMTAGKMRMLLRMLTLTVNPNPTNPKYPHICTGHIADNICSLLLFTSLDLHVCILLVTQQVDSHGVSFSANLFDVAHPDIVPPLIETFGVWELTIKLVFFTNYLLLCILQTYI